MNEAGTGAAGEGARERHSEHFDRLKPASDLKHAMRRVRVESAERSHVVADLHAAEIARLEILQDALAPVLAQVPASCDMFDLALMPSEHPRLFIDMLGFVEMGRDRRLYRFLQDTRHARLTICETEQLDKIVEAVTTYIAQRLVERERALASDAGAPAPSPDIARRDVARADVAGPDVARPDVAPFVPAPASLPRAMDKRTRSARLFVACVDIIGIVALLALIAAAALYALQVPSP